MPNGDSLSILINAILNTKQTTQDTKTKLKQVEQEINKTPIQLRIETNVGLAAQEMSKAAKQYEKVWEQAFQKQKQSAIQNATEIKNAFNSQIFDNFNKSLGIGNTSKSAKESMGVFQQIFHAEDKAIEIQKAKGQQFWKNFNSSLGIGEVKKSAKESANVFEELFQKTGKSTKGLSDVEKQVQKLNPALKTASSHTYDIGSMFEQGAKKALIWLGVMNLIYIPIRALGTAVATMKEVETQLTSISRVMEDVNFNMQQFGASLFNVADKTGMAFKDASDVALRFAQAGYGVADTLQLTETALMAVQTAELDATSATESLIGIMSQWQMSASEMPLLLDKINKISDEYTLTSQDLVDGLLRSSAAAKNLGISLNETISLLTVMRETSGRTGKIDLPTCIVIYMLNWRKSVKAEIANTEVSL